jgi:hypothetical protein
MMLSMKDLSSMYHLFSGGSERMLPWPNDHHTKYKILAVITVVMATWSLWEVPHSFACWSFIGDKSVNGL